MCGRYVTPRLEGIEPLFDIDVAADDLPPQTFNARPSFGPADVQPPVPVVIESTEGDTRTRRLVPAQWPFVPTWSKDRWMRASRFNARAEGIADKPMWREAIRSKRAIFPAVGYFETQGRGRGSKRFYFHPAGDQPLALGGVWSWWRAADTDDWLLTAAIVTMMAPEPAARVHDRAPLVLPAGRWDVWLDPTAKGSQPFVDDMARAARSQVARLGFFEVGKLNVDAEAMIRPV